MSKKTKLSRPKDELLEPFAFVGEKYLEDSLCQIFEYSVEGTKENSAFEDFESLLTIKDNHTNLWLNIHGLHEIEMVSKCCEFLDIHPMVLADVLNTYQRPKMDAYENYIFFTVRSLLEEEDDSDIHSEQISFILGKNYVLSFQERVGDHFKHVRKRLRGHTGIIHQKGPDYLLFILLQAIIDNYYQNIQTIDDKIEDISTRALEGSDPSILLQIESLKKKLLHLRKTVFPMKEALVRIERMKSDILPESSMPYYMDLKDHCLYLLDEIETHRSALESATNFYFSSQSHRMNEVMKTLTIVATIFIPLTFVAGIYGMNFEGMPELHWEYGYLSIWGLMFVITIGMIFYIRQKKWV